MTSLQYQKFISSHPKTYLFHGPSGCGKDTQIDELVKVYPGKFEKIGTGDMFRTLYKKGQADAIKAHKYYSNGKWVPDELTYKMLRKWLLQFDKEKDWIFVSVVRTFPQVAMFDDLLAKFGRTLDLFVHFKLDVEIAIQRMAPRVICPKCGTTYHPIFNPEKTAGFCDKDGVRLVHRDDDKPESIRQRINEYKRTIKPILKAYEKRDILIEIDASPSIQEIHKEIMQKIFGN